MSRAMISSCKGPVGSDCGSSRPQARGLLAVRARRYVAASCIAVTPAPKLLVPATIYPHAAVARLTRSQCPRTSFQLRVSG